MLLIIFRIQTISTGVATCIYFMIFAFVLTLFEPIVFLQALKSAVWNVVI